MDEVDLRGFRNVCRLFPLPGVVLFPHTILPLHIFEERYKQLTEDALASDRLVTMVQPRQSESDPGTDAPRLEPIACLGKILHFERLPDGRFNYLLLGLKRVRLVRELRSEKLYRLARAEIIEDEPFQGADGPIRCELIESFRSTVLNKEEMDPDVTSLLETALTLGALTDIISYSLSMPPELKQALLAEASVERRAEGLLEILRRLAGCKPVPSRLSRSYPLSFSDN